MGTTVSVAAMPKTSPPAASGAMLTVTYEQPHPAPEKPILAEVFAGLPVTETIEIIPEKVKGEPEGFEEQRSAPSR